MTLHADAIDFLRELLKELDSMPATRMLLGPKGTTYYERGKAIVRRAEDLAYMAAGRRLRDSLAELAKRYRGKAPLEHAVLEALINAKTACAQVGDGDSIPGIDAAALIVEDWLARNGDLQAIEEKRQQLGKPAAGGPFAGDPSLFNLSQYQDPGDVGRRA